MSGPIVRKYGFPNFDQIFGKRDLQHGVDEPAAEPSGEPATPPSEAGAGTNQAEAPTKGAKGKPKSK
jgi:hypothetical protein